MNLEEEVFKISTVDSWSELKERLVKFNTNWVFRGHSDTAWYLSNTLGRLKLPPSVLKYPTSDMVSIEKSILHHFERNLDEYGISQYLASDKLTVLSLLQHYGAPTRLLDFTYSPFVAAFFANRDNMKQDKEGAIYAVNIRNALMRTDMLIRQVAKENVNDKDDGEIFAKYLLNKSKVRTAINLSNSETFIDFAFNLKKPIPFIAYVDAKYSHPRSNSQQGCFLSVGDITKTFYENINIQHTPFNFHGYQEDFIKIIIPPRVKDEMQRELMQMNITEVALFPGLDGFSRSLYQKSVMDIIRGEDFKTG